MSITIRFFFLLPFLSFPLSAQIVLSEVMFDLEGTDSPNEFVEIYNVSTDETVDLSGYRISDKFSLDELVDAGRGMSLPPLSYGVILEGDYDIETGIYATIIPDTALILKVDDNSIGNQLSATDSLFLISPEGDTVDSHGWENISSPGFSIERIRLNHPSVKSNWAISKDSLGTPGFINSVAALEFDAAILPDAISHSPQTPTPEDHITVSITLFNSGTSKLDGTVEIREDESLLGETQFVDLHSLDTIQVDINIFSLNSGTHILNIFVNANNDLDPSNNSIQYILIVSFTERVLTINEFLYAPDPGVVEFIEFVNLSDDSLDLMGWSFSDSDTSNTRIFPHHKIPPGGYFTTSKDSSLLTFFPDEFTLLIPENGFPALNNSGDAIYLFDPSGVLMDSLIYTVDWGGKNGRSLEKLNPTLESSSQSNWGTCVAAEKMTPGRLNSIYFESLARAGTITLNPNPFSPDGDGYEDELRISYHIPFSQSFLTIQIFDNLGRSIRTLAKNLVIGSKGVISWDGRTNRNKKARIGLYIIKISVVELESKKHMEWVKTVVLAERLR